MEISIQENVVLSVVGEVTVCEIFSDGTKKIKRNDKNIVVSDGILLLLNYFFSSETEEKLSGITHLAVGIGKPDFIDDVQESEKKNMMYGMKRLKEEQFRVVSLGYKYYNKDDFGNFIQTNEATNIVEFSFRLRQNEPLDVIYISEIGMFGGKVRVNEVPVAQLILDSDGNISDGTKGAEKSQVLDLGTMFSYRYYDPPIDKFPETILEFVWRINFVRG